MFRQGLEVGFLVHLLHPFRKSLLSLQGLEVGFLLHLLHPFGQQRGGWWECAESCGAAQAWEHANSRTSLAFFKHSRKVLVKDVTMWRAPDLLKTMISPGSLKNQLRQIGYSVF